MSLKIVIPTVLYLLSFPFAVSAETVLLPRTGQTVSYGSRDDGALQTGVPWPTPRFTDNSNGAVTDNMTGLVWLKDANCRDTVGGIDKSNGYLAWLNALIWSNSLTSGKCGLTDGSAAGQWRLPNRKELLSLFDHSQYNPVLPTGHPFINVQANGYYWSSSSWANPGIAWFLYMYDGYLGSLNKTLGYFAWPVRSGISTPHAPVQLPRTGQTVSYAAGDDGALQKGAVWPEPRFRDNGNGTVTDNLTGLIWLKDADCRDTVGGINKSSGGLVWADALTWCNNLDSGACSLSDGSKAGDWRLPNITELESLVDLQSYNPPLPSGHPFINVQAWSYWSSSSYHYTYSAWYVGMVDGYVNDGNKNDSSDVWPVRGTTLRVWIHGTTKYFPLLQGAHDDAMDGDSIWAMAVEFKEHLTIDKDLMLKGGFDAGFTNSVGSTILNGTLTIGSGSLTVDKLMIQ
jgi:hypothetical protein